MSLYHVKNNTIGDMTGTVTVFNSAGVTTTAAATDLVRPGDWNSAHSQVVTLSGNTAGASTASGTNIVFQGGNNVTASVNQGANAATIVFSGANTVAQTVQTQASGNIVGSGFTSTTTAGTALVGTQNSNGLSLGVPAWITTFQNDLTSGRAGTGFTSTTTAGTAIVATLNTNGLSAGVPAYLTTYVNDLTSGRAGTGFTSTTTAGTAIVGTLNTNGLSVGVPTIITNALTTAANSTHSHGNPTLALTNITGTTASASNGLTLSLSGVAAQTTQTQPAGNIAGVGTTFGGTNISATIGLNSNGLDLQLSGGGGGTTNQTGPNIAAGTQTATSGTVIFSNANGVTFGLNNQTVTASVNAGGVTASNYVPFPLVGSNSTFTAFGLNSLHLQHFFVPVHVSMHKVEIYARNTFTSSSNSQVVAQTIRYGMYSQDGTGASSTRMTLMASSSALFTASYNSSTTAGFTMAAGGTTFNTGTNNTTIFSGISGANHLYLPFATSLQPNVKYAFGILSSSATTVNTGPLRFSGFYCIPIITSNMGRMDVSGSQAASSTVIGDYDMGIYGTTTGGMVDTYASSQLGIAISRQKLFLQFDD